MASLQFSEGDDSRPLIRHRAKQLLNNIVDGMARERPWAVYAEIPKLSNNYEGGYRQITYSALANAINGVAWLLKDRLGESKTHQTLAYIGPNDISYVVMILGAVKAGYKLLLVSPRNTISDHISLFKATDCKSLLTPPLPQSPIVPRLLDVFPLKVIDSPSLDDLLSKSHPHYPFPKTFAMARKEPLVVVHTSGTTAVPKPIVYSHDFAATYIQYDQLRPPPGFESQVSLCQSNRFFMTLPFFHAGNLMGTLIDAIANQTVIVSPLAGAMPSAHSIVEGLRHAKADAMALAPPFLEQIANSPEMLDFVGSELESIVYGGGDVSQKAGDALASRVKLFNFSASTETGSVPLLRPSGDYPHEDWRYIHPHPAAGLVFRPSVEGLFEAVIVRNDIFEDEQPVFKIFPHLDEYPTRDLFAPHPTKPDLWAHHGRADDTIIFQPGYMCNPVKMEQQVSQHPEVLAVLMVGTGRCQPALLIERKSNKVISAAEECVLVEQLWPMVAYMNAAYKMGARVSKTHILFTDPQKPMRRAGKGSVQRAPTLQFYKQALDDLYAREGDALPGNEMVLPKQRFQS